MGEKEPIPEIIKKGELFFLSHPDNETIFSGYGLTLQSDRKDYLAGLLMVDRPKPRYESCEARNPRFFGKGLLSLIV